MNRTKILCLVGLSGIGTLMAPYAVAQERPYFYTGASIGQSQSQLDEQATVNNLLGYKVPTTVTRRTPEDTGYRLFGGYQMNRNIALEGGYFNLGKSVFDTTTLAGPLRAQTEVEGINIDVVYTLPLSERWSVLGRLGAQYAHTRTGYDGRGLGAGRAPYAFGVGNQSKDDSNLKAGVGVQYELSPSLFLRGEAERYRIHDGINTKGDIDLFSVSLVVPFGREGRRVAPVMAPTPYVAPAPIPTPPPPPAPMPMVVTPPPAPPPPVVAPAPRRVQFSADSLFNFNQTTIGSNGQSALDTFARELKSTRFNTIMVEGHTDRIGSASYNEKLSLKRAQVVKDYLSKNNGIDASRISVVGKGETSPVTQPGDCKGDKPTPKLIACLQPDRRVVVEVTGER